MLIKRPIYNQKLKCVALEIIAHHESDLTAVKKSFTELLQTIEIQVPLFLPYRLKILAEGSEVPIENPIILNLNGNDINIRYSPEEIENSIQSIALFIQNPQQLSWLNFADYVGLGRELTKMQEGQKIVKISQSKQRKVIGYNIDKPQEFEHCKLLGMDYYCGDFLFEPNVEDSCTVSANTLNLLELVRLLQEENTDTQAVTNLIEKDALLSYQLLKLANSAAFAGLRPMESIDQAISRLGLIQLKNWAIVFSMKNISNKPIEVIESGLIRAQMATKLALNNKPQAYTAGLLSILDSVLNQPMTEITKKLHLADDIQNALIGGEGELSELLKVIKAYEAGNFDQLPSLEYKGVDLSEIYIQALTQIAEGQGSGLKE